MVKEFLNFSQQHKLFSPANKVLLAVSGGIDSMVMASLFREAGINHAIAHCNFSLRGAESDGDEQFVRAYAVNHNIPLFFITFDTLACAASRRISVQMAARDLRYEWFEKIIREEGFDAVAVAHNLNDNVETFLINLLRGTGLNGLTGISPRNGNIIRPLLFLTRDQIVNYAVRCGIEHREDSSNEQVKYTRNRIRHLVLPELEAVNPGSLYAITNTIDNLNNTAIIMDVCMERISKDIFRHTDKGTEADINAICALPGYEAFIFELFRKYGISGRQTGEMKALLESPPGKYISTTSHRIYKDREKIIIREKESYADTEYTFASIDEMRISELFSDVSIMKPGSDPLPADQRIASLDLALIQFPVRVRKWQPGDRFSPLGMKGIKKISDFLIDQKVPVAVKDQTLVLLSGEDIAWVIGQRIDERFKITGETERILMITL